MIKNRKTRVVLTGSLVVVLAGIGYYLFHNSSHPSTYRVIYYGIERAPTWTTFLDGIGSFSSPRVTDLNRDGVGDIVVGAGRQEFQKSDTAVIALDGITGELIWKSAAENQVFGSPLFYDITEDGVNDVLIGGRNGIFKAIDGAEGQIIWNFHELVDQASLGKKYFNFYNPQLIPDQDGDGLRDILVANGGDVLKQPFDADRPVGHLMVMGSRNGKIIAEAPMPDGKETYLSAVLSNGGDDGELEIAFGTGGETIGGSLYVASLANVLAGDLTKAIRLASKENKGFIAPPVWVDINADGKEDLVAASVDGEVFAFDIGRKELLWKTVITGTEIYSTPAIGYFKNREVPGVYVTSAIGTWPNLGFSKHSLLDGASGKIVQTDTLGYFQSSSPVVIDLNGDGLDEALLSVNYESFSEDGKKTYQNTLFLVDFLDEKMFELMKPLDGQNIASTPWLGDLDGDGELDIIFCHSANLTKEYAFDGMNVNRIKTSVAIKTPILWGGYMGSEGNGRISVVQPID